MKKRKDLHIITRKADWGFLTEKMDYCASRGEPGILEVCIAFRANVTSLRRLGYRVTYIRRKMYEIYWGE